ncbi:hypothetical protein SERLA73DRAFT_26124, partial [Serpula lacrymans var. lacrymans S7.3]
VPLGVPLYATSATMSPAVLVEVCRTLHINTSYSFHLNLGNDRPNVTQEVQIISSPMDYSALDFLVKDVGTPKKIPQALIFVNTINQSQAGFRRLHKMLPARLKGQVDFLNSPRTRKTVLQDFCDGKIRAMFVTEIGGIGPDIPDIELVIQFGVPPSLTVWLQRADQAACHFSLQGQAILMVEE